MSENEPQLAVQGELVDSGNAATTDIQHQIKTATRRTQREGRYSILFIKDLFADRIIQIQRAAIRSKAPTPCPAGVPE
jgi:hypothetical protein